MPLVIFGRLLHVFSAGLKQCLPTSRVKRFIQSWLINTLAVLVAAYVVSGIHYEKPLDLFLASLLLGVLNVALRPMLMFLALPLLIFTLGLFRLVINGLLLYFVGYVLRPYFYVEGFWPAFWGALIISFVSTVLNVLTGLSGSRIHIERRRPPSGPDGKGPIIDI
jgi:putative membrane protein